MSNGITNFEQSNSRKRRLAQFVNRVVDGLAGPYPIDVQDPESVSMAGGEDTLSEADRKNSTNEVPAVPDLHVEREKRIAQSFQYKILSAYNPQRGMSVLALATDDISYDSPGVAIDVRLEDQEPERPEGRAGKTVEPTPVPPVSEPRKEAAYSLRSSRWSDALKRMFDVIFALLALAITLPLYPFIMIAIWAHDGSPVFFAHKRQTRGGREFPLFKFRTMLKDAGKLKAALKALNQADGPQFFIERDPRITSFGRFLRKYKLDELPIFWNVLLGHMSIVGPRPSPRLENEHYKSAAEIKLSVRPGVTGLWQVNRTRNSTFNFQDLIKDDLEYVEHRSFRLDLWILWRTFVLTFKSKPML